MYHERHSPGHRGWGEKWPAQSAPDQNYQTLPLMVILLVSEGVFSGGGAVTCKGISGGGQIFTRSRFYLADFWGELQKVLLLLEAKGLYISLDFRSEVTLLISTTTQAIKISMNNHEHFGKYRLILFLRGWRVLYIS
jgi:hypothetical protein